MPSICSMLPKMVFLLPKIVFLWLYAFEKPKQISLNEIPAKEMRVTNKSLINAECCWNPSELVTCKWWMDYNPYSRIEVVDKMEYQKL